MKWGIFVTTNDTDGFAHRLHRFTQKKTKPLMDSYDNYSNLFPDNKKKQYKDEQKKYDSTEEFTEVKQKKKH